MPHDHDHHHDHDHSELTETQLRVRALETVLTEKGYVDPAALDLLIETYEKKVGPRNGARVVAKAWADPAYRARLFKEATSAIAELGYAGRQGEHIVALENTPQAAQHGRVHAVLLLSVAGARPAAGLVQVGALSFARGRRSARRARRFWRERCRRTPKSACGIRPSEIRYLVIPMRPAGTEGWSEDKLAELVTRDSMIGTGLPKAPKDLK